MYPPIYHTFSATTIKQRAESQFTKYVDVISNTEVVAYGHPLQHNQHLHAQYYVYGSKSKNISPLWTYPVMFNFVNQDIVFSRPIKTTLVIGKT